MAYCVELFNPMADRVAISGIAAAEKTKLPIPPGFPFLVDLGTGRLPEKANRFLLNHANLALYRATGDFPDTAQTYAYDLKPFCEFLSARGLEWDDVTEHDLIGYVDALITYRKPDTGEAWAPGVLRQRLETVLRAYAATDPKDFARWDVGLLRKRLKAYAKRMPGPAGPRAAKARRNRFLTPSEWQRVSRVLGALPDEADVAAWREAGRRGLGLRVLPRSTRGRLVAELAILTGMRIDEIAHFPLDGLPIKMGGAAFAAVWIEKTKFLKARHVYLPRELIRRLHLYRRGERRHAAAAYERRTGRAAPNRLFLARSTSPRNAGSTVESETLAAEFRAGVVGAGLVIETPVGTGDGPGVHVQPAFSIHDARDTHAVYLYALLSGEGDEKRVWLRIAARLGHERVSTTFKHYLRLVNALEYDVAAILESAIAQSIALAGSGA